MDPNEIQSFGNISPRDLEKCFDTLTPCDVNTSLEFDDSSKQEEDTKSQKTALTESKDSLNGECSISQAGSRTLETDTTDANKEAEYKDLENSYESGLNNEEVKIESTYNNKENLQKGLVLSKEIALLDESTASDSMNRISTPKDLKICLDEKKEIVFNQSHENLQIRSFTCTELPKSDCKIPSDETNTDEVVPEKKNAEATYDVKPNSDILDMFPPSISDNHKEQTIFNCDSRVQQANPRCSFGHDKNFTIVENKIDEVESVKDEIPNSKSSDHLIRSKSVAELSTVRTSKPSSLAEDAKLVKFSVSTKSVNLMQSNAQFLNKSRNFLNFITEKSTNIMEKTLLPQHLAAKYNSILRLTENNHPNYKKSIEDTGSSYDLTPDSISNLEHKCQTSNQIAFNVTNSGVQDMDTTLYDREQQDESVSDNSSIAANSTKDDQILFLKCSVNENKSNRDSTLKKQEIQTPSSNAIPDMNSESKQPNSKFETSNMIEEETISNLNFGGTGEDQNLIKSSTSDSDLLDEILRPKQEESSKLLGKDSKASNLGMDENNSIKENESNATILPSLRRVSIEQLNPEQEKDEHGVSGNSEVQLIDLGLLAHPAYVTLLRDYSNLKEQSEKLSEEKVKVEMENQRLTAENNGELYALQLETLEKTIEQLRHDLKQSIASQKLINKEYLLANKEKESMVMKYAIGEKQLIETQRAREYAERKVNEALKEQELLHTKLKQVQGERTRICNILDGKCHELTDAQKEIDRLKEELSMREVKLKWSQNKLKTELEAHKEDQQKLEKAMLRINEMKEECEQVRKESQETIRKFQQSEENKVVTLDHQLKEQQARLILERHVTEDKESSRLQLQKEVETLKQRQHALIEENNTLSLKVQDLEKERLNYENNLSNLKVIADQRQKEIVDLVGKVSQLETLKLQLKHKEQLLSSNEAEVERLRQSNTELQSDMEWCREREAHMLEFTQKLTDKNVRLQSEFTSMEAKNEQLELEQGPLHDQIKELSSKLKALEISLASEKSKRTEECELLARHVAEQTQLARNLAQKLEDSQGENAVLRRKQQISVKEMTKELQQCKKRLDAFETGSPSNSLDRTSRTGSSSSLSTGETLNGAVSDNSNSGDHILQSVEPDRQTLIDRIVKLQRIRVRQAEKLDFLEEHSRTLVNELQKKTKIIKNYILHENPDAMGSNERDRNKAELARHGGIMASVYNQRVSDDNMTLELSLEMNQKLQAVLEDTLLKNITLKDSIDTLGGEIARLTMQNKRRQ